MNRVRTVAPADLGTVLDALVVLEAELFEDAWDAAALTDLVGGYGRRLHVGGEGAEVSGYVLTQTLGDFTDLLRIGTAPAARREGVASALLAAASADAVADGAERVLLEVSEANTGARAFYDRHGFVEIDRRPGYYRDGSAALVLERPLSPAPHDENHAPTTGEGE